jgi:hypothetical protein
LTPRLPPPAITYTPLSRARRSALLGKRKRGENG